MPDKSLSHIGVYIDPMYIFFMYCKRGRKVETARRNEQMNAEWALHVRDKCKKGYQRSRYTSKQQAVRKVGNNANTSLAPCLDRRTWSNVHESKPEAAI